MECDASNTSPKNGSPIFNESPIHVATQTFWQNSMGGASFSAGDVSGSFSPSNDVKLPAVLNCDRKSAAASATEGNAIKQKEADGLAIKQFFANLAIFHTEMMNINILCCLLNIAPRLSIRSRLT